MALSHQHAHVFALGKGRGHQRRELAAVGNHLLNVHFVDDVVDLRSSADNPNLRPIAIRTEQQFVELCGHDNLPQFVLIVVKQRPKATASQAACVAEACPIIDTALPSAFTGDWVSWLVVLDALLVSDLASNLCLPGRVEPNQLRNHKLKLVPVQVGICDCDSTFVAFGISDNNLPLSDIEILAPVHILIKKM